MTANGFVNMWLAYYGVLKRTFPSPQKHHRNQKIKDMVANCIHKAPVWFILLLSVKGASCLALAHFVEELGYKSTC